MLQNVSMSSHKVKKKRDYDETEGVYASLFMENVNWLQF